FRQFLTPSNPRQNLRLCTRSCGHNENGYCNVRTTLAVLLSLLSGSAWADCKEPETGTKDIPAFSPPLSELVTGTGRLQFYSAPDQNCAMKGVFVVPKDQLIAYAQSDDGWTSVMYSNPKTG